MLRQIIDWSVSNRMLVGVLVVFAVVSGFIALQRTPLEALPDLSDVQVIIETNYEGQAPQIVEDQVTYPITTEMLKVPGAETVRGYSFFGVSFVYIIFKDGTDLYWARSRVQEYLSSIRGKLPTTAQAALGPDATGLGWVYEYVLEDTTGTRSLADLRAIQDWNLRYQLTGVPGVSEVASVGGFEKTYQVTIDPNKLRAYNVSVMSVMEALRTSNQDVGAMMMELSEREFMVRGRGYLHGMADIENTVILSTEGGTPVRIADVGHVEVTPDVRRGVADLNGRGNVVGGIVVMRSGQNALATIQRVKQRLAAVERSLPAGITIRPVYDRSELIKGSIKTLREKLIEESIVVALVCLIFLFHVRSALVAIITLPVGILTAFIAMRLLGVGADIMSLGGIAIAIGAMIDAAIVMIENMHKHLERAGAAAGGEITDAERWRIVAQASKEVGPALFFSLIIIAVSFLPVFALEAQEGRLFKPLAWTKTLSIAAAALLSVTLVPVAMGYFIRGRIHEERRNPVFRALVAVYRPVIELVLRYRLPVIAAAVAAIIISYIPFKHIGSEFMPPLDEGTILYMPTTLPGIGVAKASSALQRQDSILKSIPEVQSVFGKAGRATTATDPAGLDMTETTIVLKPSKQWRHGMTSEKLVAEMDSLVRMAGYTNAWTMPIKGRIDMLATGIRTPVGIKVYGPDLGVLTRIGKDIEKAVGMVPGTRSVFAERAISGYYIDVDIDRAAAARYGIKVQDIQDVLATAIGGMTITKTVEGRQRYSVRLRYPQELRDSPEHLASEVLIPAANGSAQVPLGQLATIRNVSGPMVVRTEDAFPTAWVYVDVQDRDIGTYVADAKKMVARMVDVPAGYTLQWSGQYEYMQRAKNRLVLVIPLVLLLIFLLLYFNFKNVGETLIVMLSLPFAIVGGIFFMALLGYNWSVATAIGFIALAGVAAETGVVMLVYLDHAWEARLLNGKRSSADLYEAIIEGAVERVRPKMMTVTAIIAGLLPILWGHGTGASVMKRIAAPMVGGMVSSTLLTLIVIPAIYSLWKEWQLSREAVTTPPVEKPERIPLGV